MPEVGEIKKAWEIGYKGSYKYIWIICPTCNKGRWVCLSHTKKAEHTGKCKDCLAGSFKLSGHPNWKGGHYINPDGYVMLKVPNHPRADRNGYVKRARVVLENKLGRHLWPNADPHHINGIKIDDTPENLTELFHEEHQSLHMRQRSRKINTSAGEPGIREGS